MKAQNWKSKLSGYATLSASFILMSNKASTQVVYVDIDPDVILDLPGEQFTLDIDGNGINDITLFNSSFSFYMATPWWSYWLRQDLIVQVNNDLFIAGLKHYDWYYEAYTYYPFALDNFALIDGNLEFFNASFQVLALRTFFNYGLGTMYGFNCYWFHLDSNIEMLNKFIGFHLGDAGGNNHYGWIRCDVIDTGRTLIIKDYAYELTPDNPILAGDTTHYVTIEQYPIENTPQIYTFGTTIQINGLLSNTSISIYNLTGAKVSETIATSKSISIPMGDFTSGVYLVKLKNEEIDITRKLVLN